MSNFTDARAKLVSCQVFVLYSKNATGRPTELELFNYVEHIFLSESDRLRWRFTVFTNSELVVGFQTRLRGRGTFVFASHVISSTFWSDCRGQVGSQK